MRLNSKTEKRLFNWDEVKHLTKKEMYHLFIESAVTGWDTVEQQKQHHHKVRQNNGGPISSWKVRSLICWECEDIFKKLKEVEN